MGKGTGKFVAGVAIGAAVGAAAGILFAPQSGKETREELKVKLEELKEKAKDIKFADVKEKIEEKIEELKKEIADLDKEKVMSYAKDKAKQVKEKANELVKLAKDKGTPVLEDAAERRGQILDARHQHGQSAEKEKRGHERRDLLQDLHHLRRAVGGEDAHEDLRDAQVGADADFADGDHAPAEDRHPLAADDLRQVALKLARDLQLSGRSGLIHSR